MEVFDLITFSRNEPRVLTLRCAIGVQIMACTVLCWTYDCNVQGEIVYRDDPVTQSCVVT